MIIKRSSLFLLGLLFLVSSAALAQYPVIDADQLRSRMASKKKTILIDTRTADEYQQGHIPGAVNIMPDSMKEQAARLPKNKKTSIVFYCRGVN